MRLSAIPALAVAVLLYAAGAPVLAQETVTIDGVEAQRVIIAPPRNDLEKAIKAGLSSAYASATPDTRAYREAQKLYYFYGGRHFAPLWLTPGGDGHVAYSDKAARIISVFENAKYEGLRAEDYLTDAISLDVNDPSPQKIAELETAFSAAAIRYAQDAAGGRIDPRTISSSITLEPRQVNGAEFLLKLAASDDPGQTLLDMSPKVPEFLALKAALAKRYAGDVETRIVIPEGTGLVRPGMSDSRIPLIRERLQLAATATPTLYDDALKDAVRAFQEEKGLLVDGVIGPATIGALNGGGTVTTADIIANMERWRWMPDLGDFYVFVNIPEFRVYVERGGQTTYSTRVIVGQKTHQTPVFSDEIEYVVVNPYWNVPASIASAEIGPALRANPNYLASHNMQMFTRGGQVVNAAAVNWSTTSINNFTVRQNPGPGNALGHVKFLFPNAHNVYLHDTPSRSLFARGYRTFSHGCVRVQNPMDFAQALLVEEPSITRASLEAQYGPRERWNSLKHHIAVHIAYFTVRADANGNLQSFPDPYGINERVEAALGE